MKKVALMLPTKEQEQRRALRPCDAAGMRHANQIYIPHHYGFNCGYTDEDYEQAGVHIGSEQQLLDCDIFCDPKIGDALYLPSLPDGAIVFGWVHAAETQARAELLQQKKFTAYAWENMNQDGRHVFFKNNELAGKAAVLHAFSLYGALPQGKRVAILGNGNTARGAMQILHQLGALVDVYPRKAEHSFQAHFDEYDVIVNCILWDVNRNDHILYRKDLAYMKPHAMIIDIGCDEHCAIETSHTTTMDAPTYLVDGILHYAVDHTPSLYYRTFLEESGPIIAQYLDLLVENAPNEVLAQAKILADGQLLDDEILTYLNMQKQHTEGSSK